jgi:hypothetical protein
MYPRLDLNIQMYIAMIEYVIYDTYISYREKGHLNMNEKLYLLDFTVSVCQSFLKTIYLPDDGRSGRPSAYLS